MRPRLGPYELSAFGWNTVKHSDKRSNGRLNFPVATPTYPTLSKEQARREGRRARRIA